MSKTKLSVTTNTCSVGFWFPVSNKNEGFSTKYMTFLSLCGNKKKEKKIISAFNELICTIPTKSLQLYLQYLQLKSLIKLDPFKYYCNNP